LHQLIFGYLGKMGGEKIDVSLVSVRASFVVSVMLMVCRV